MGENDEKKEVRVERKEDGKAKGRGRNKIRTSERKVCRSDRGQKKKRRKENWMKKENETEKKKKRVNK